MTVTHSSLARADLKPRNPGHRTTLGSMLLAIAVMAVLVAGGWGVVSSLTTEAPPARIGEQVAVTGGLLSVDALKPEHMAPMQMKKFSASGMSMSATGMDMAPDGYERFAVDISLAAQSGSITYSPDDFQVSGEGLKTHGPIRSQLIAGSIAEGEAVSGSLVFQVPEKAKNLTLNFDGGRSVALDLPAGKDGGHSQEDGSQKGGHDH